jgi:hypothetical protein
MQLGKHIESPDQKHKPMKIHRLLALGLVVAALTASRGMAQTIITSSYTNMFLTDGNTTYFTGGSVASWLYWYANIPTNEASFGNTAMTNDPTMTESGDTNTYGSLYCALPFSGTDQQVQIFGTFDNEYGYDNSEQIPLSLITNIGFDIHVLPGTMTNTDGNFGQITMSLVDPGWQGGGRVGNWTGITIPGAATNGWVHVTDANLTADIASMELSETAQATVYTNAAGIGLYIQSYGGYPTSAYTCWIDNVAVTTAAAPPPPPPPPTLSIAPAVQGLNLFTGSGQTLYNRESLETTGNDYSWVGAAGPVSYSFTISSYPVPTNAAVQNHIFLDPNPSTGSAPDYVDPNLVFLDLESTATGGTAWMFRYKTNEPNGNAMVYGSGTLAQINSSNAVGTYTVTFVNNTNVTMTVADGSSTNFDIPDSTGATSALFASGVVLYYGVQAGNLAGTGDHIVASDFNVTGLGSADFNDNFVADAGTLDTSIWEVNENFANCVQLVGPGEPFWVQWTTPALGFSLQSTPTLSTNSTWTPVTSNPTFLSGTNETQLISTNDLPSGKTGYFSVVKRSFSQLLILLPGETNAPNTPTGKNGTPSPFSISATGGLLTFTVLAVDAKFYPVSGVSDTLSFSDNDGGAYQSPFTLVNGAGQFSVYYSAPSSGVVITATDVTTTTIPPANSTSFTVSP